MPAVTRVGERSSATFGAAVDAWAPALEVVEFNRPFEELEDVLAEGVFHKAVVLGPFKPPRPGVDLAGIEATVDLAEVRVCDVDAREATGPVPEVLRHLARLLDPFGERLASGDVIILGAMNPPCMGREGARFSLQLESVGDAVVHLGA